MIINSELQIKNLNLRNIKDFIILNAIISTGQLEVHSVEKKVEFNLQIFFKKLPEIKKK